MIGAFAGVAAVASGRAECVPPASELPAWGREAAELGGLEAAGGACIGADRAAGEPIGTSGGRDDGADGAAGGRVGTPASARGGGAAGLRIEGGAEGSPAEGAFGDAGAGAGGDWTGGGAMLRSSARGAAGGVGAGADGTVGTALGVGLRPGANGGTRVGVIDRDIPAGGVNNPAPPAAAPGIGPRGASCTPGRSGAVTDLAAD